MTAGPGRTRQSGFPAVLWAAPSTRMFVTLPDQRHTVIEQASGLVFRIPSRCHVFGVVLLTLGLCVWLIIEIAAPIFLLQALFHPAEFFIFVFVCVAVWTVGGLFALRLWLWQLKGCEIITLSPTALVIQRAIFGFGRRRSLTAETKRFALAQVLAQLRPASFCTRSSRVCRDWPVRQLRVEMARRKKLWNPSS
jgi:hypothetical protein